MSGLPVTGTQLVQPTERETLALLEEFASLNFMLHTHHPMTHVPVGDAALTQGRINVRTECAEGLIPVGSFV